MSKHQMFEAFVCPVCGLIDDGRFGTNATCAGVRLLNEDHEPVTMERVALVSLDAVVEHLSGLDPKGYNNARWFGERVASHFRGAA